MGDGEKRISVRSGHGVGKGQSVYELVLTPYGWSAIGGLAVGDQVASVDGSFCRVTGVFPQGRRPLYRVALDDGSSVITDDQHLWFTTTRSERKNGRAGRVRSTPEIAASLTFPNGASRGLNHQIPTVAAIQHQTALLPVEPYTLGVWLGDGSKGSGQYSKPDEHVAAELLAVGQTLGPASAGRSGTRTVHGLIGGLRALGLLDKGSHERFIPDVYRFADVNQRTAVLQGILDTDGTVGENQAVVLDTTAPALAAHVADLVRSLGGLCRRSEKMGTLYGVEHRRVYRLFISLPPEVAPFRAATKANRYRPAHGHKNRQRTLRRFISGVTPVGEGESVCIAVDHPSHLYVTRDHIVTHNTTLEAWLALWFPSTRPDAKVGVTGPAGPQLEMNLWPEVRKWHPRLRDSSPAGKWLASQMQINELEIKFANENLVKARTARPDQPEALQGLHATNVLILIDEASGIAESMYEANIGALSTEGAIQAIFSNPTQSSGYFYRSQHEQSDRWKTLRVSSLDVPNAQGHVDDVVANYGKDSNQYRVRVLGEFPDEQDDAVIPLYLIDAAVARKGKIARIEGLAPVWGVDVAWMGGDRSALAKRCGNELLEPVKWWSGNDPHQTAQRVFLEWQDTDEDMRPAAIMVDAIGMGAGAHLKLKELGLPSRMVNVGEAAAADERYMRLRDELWFRGRAWLQDAASIMCADNALKAELVAVKYRMTPTGKTQVESKDEMRKRGLRSPDLADAFLNTFAGGEHKRQPRSKERKYGRDRKRSGGSWMSA